MVLPFHVKKIQFVNTKSNTVHENNTCSICCTGLIPNKAHPLQRQSQLTFHGVLPKIPSSSKMCFVAGQSFVILHPHQTHWKLHGSWPLFAATRELGKGCYRCLFINKMVVMQNRLLAVLTILLFLQGTLCFSCSSLFFSKEDEQTSKLLSTGRQPYNAFMF